MRYGAMLVILALSAGCRHAAARPDYTASFDAAAFVPGVNNRFFPLVPGTRYEYREGDESVTLEVLSETRVVMGVATTIVHDQVRKNGKLIEDTFDWYAQDRNGTVWYFGEDSREMDGDRVLNRHGSWEAGVNGARPGIIMWGNPAAHIGEPYRQEFAAGTAEDYGKVVAVDVKVTVPYGNFTGCVKTEDWNALKRFSQEGKFYCPDVGLVRETIWKTNATKAALISVTRPRARALRWVGCAPLLRIASSRTSPAPPDSHRAHSPASPRPTPASPAPR